MDEILAQAFMQQVHTLVREHYGPVRFDSEIVRVFPLHATQENEKHLARIDADAEFIERWPDAFSAWYHFESYRFADNVIKSIDEAQAKFLASHAKGE